MPRRSSKKDTPAKLAKRMKRRWRVVLLRAKGEILGTVEAPDVVSAKAAAAIQCELGTKSSARACSRVRLAIAGCDRLAVKPSRQPSAVASRICRARRAASQAGPRQRRGRERQRMRLAGCPSARHLRRIPEHTPDQ